jgi:hypothetical protein
MFSVSPGFLRNSLRVADIAEAGSGRGSGVPDSQISLKIPLKSSHGLAHTVWLFDNMAIRCDLRDNYVTPRGICGATCPSKSATGGGPRFVGAFPERGRRKVVERFRNAVAIVTGGGGGIGAAICDRLASEGAHVVVSDVDKGLAETVATGLGDRGLLAEARAVDITSREACMQLVDDVAATHGRVGVTSACIPPIVARGPPDHRGHKTFRSQGLCVFPMRCTSHAADPSPGSRAVSASADLRRHTTRRESNSLISSSYLRI